MLFSAFCTGAKFRAFPLQETTQPLCNPWRGLYTIYRYRVLADISASAQSQIAAWAISPEQSLALVEVNLQAFRAQMLSAGALEQIEQVLIFFVQQRKQLLLRFLYDWDGHGIQNEPDELDTILQHIRHLAPLLHQYTDLIFVLQGFFIGSWGEMHSTRFSGESELAALLREMNLAAGKRTFLAVRCPNQWRLLYRSFRPLHQSEAFSGEGGARTGLFNDAIFGSDTDFGTYGHTSAHAALSPGEKLLREDELDFQDQLCRFVPSGGEVVSAQTPVAVKVAMRTMQRMHLSYLNAAYDPAILDRWKATSIDQPHSVWNGSSYFNYLAQHLGYRYLVESVRLERRRRDSCTLCIVVCNKGFASCYYPMDVSVQALCGGTLQTYPVYADLRCWAPGQSITLRVELPLPTSDAAFQILGLAIQDHTGRFIRLANTPMQPDCPLTNPLGVLTR